MIPSTGCALKADPLAKSVIKDCVLPDDQAGTLSAHWKVTPVPIAFKQNDWGPDEIADMTKAADSWNTFYSASLGMQALDYGGDPKNPKMSTAAKPSALCGQGIVQGSKFNGQVVIYKSGRWPYPNLPEAIALTSFCPLPAKPLPTMYMAIMEVNYQNFFVEGRRVPDLQTIVLHELGHLMGLNHSCEGVQRPGTPVCNANVKQEYAAAVMFPKFSFDQTGAGEQKRDLTDNDQGRANCLYVQTGNAK